MRVYQTVYCMCGHQRTSNFYDKLQNTNPHVWNADNYHRPVVSLYGMFRPSVSRCVTFLIQPDTFVTYYTSLLFHIFKLLNSNATVQSIEYQTVTFNSLTISPLLERKAFFSYFYTSLKCLSRCYLVDSHKGCLLSSHFL